MADRVSVLAVTLVGDEKRRLGERRISATGRFLLPSLEETSRLLPVYFALYFPLMWPTGHQSFWWKKHWLLVAEIVEGCLQVAPIISPPFLY